MARTAGLTRAVVLAAALSIGGCQGGQQPAGPVGSAPATLASPSTGGRAPAGPGLVSSSGGSPAATCRHAVPSAARLTPGQDLVEGLSGTWVVIADGDMVSGWQVTPEGARLSVQDGRACSDLAGTRVVRTTSTLVDQARWVRRGTVRSLRVTPSWVARSWPGATEALVTRLRSAYPEMTRPGMADQLRCHVAFAASKDRWNLEPGRPDVGYPATVAAGCNPGDLVDPDGR